MPWWAYGPQGMMLWFPSLITLPEPFPTSSSTGNLTSTSSTTITATAAAAAPSLAHAHSCRPTFSAQLLGSSPPKPTARGSSDNKSGSNRPALASQLQPAHSAPLLTRRGSSGIPGSPFAAALADVGWNAGGGGNDMELEFDKEVYPIGISLADASIVGVTQRLLRPQQQQQQQAISHTDVSVCGRIKVSIRLGLGSPFAYK